MECTRNVNRPQNICYCVSGLALDRRSALLFSIDFLCLWLQSVTKLFIPQVFIPQVFFPKRQFKFYPQFQKAKPKKHVFEPIYIPRALNMGTSSNKVTYFILRACTGTGVSHIQHRKVSREVLEKMHVN